MSSAEVIARRKRLVDEWNAWRVRCRGERGIKGDELAPKEEEKEKIEVWVDEVIEQTEEVVIDDE